MTEYMPPEEWTKVDPWTAEAPDGSKAWLDARGLVGLTRPDGTYLSFGARLADSGADPHDGNLGPPREGSRISVFTEDTLMWERDGRSTESFVPTEHREAYLESISNAMSVVGYTVEYQRVA